MCSGYEFSTVSHYTVQQAKQKFGRNNGILQYHRIVTFFVIFEILKSLRNLWRSKFQIEGKILPQRIVQGSNHTFHHAILLCTLNKFYCNLGSHDTCFGYPNLKENVTRTCPEI